MTTTVTEPNHSIETIRDIMPPEIRDMSYNLMVKVEAIRLQLVPIVELANEHLLIIRDHELAQAEAFKETFGEDVWFALEDGWGQLIDVVSGGGQLRDVLQAVSDLVRSHEYPAAPVAGVE